MRFPAVVTAVGAMVAIAATDCASPPPKPVPAASVPTAAPTTSSGSKPTAIAVDPSTPEPLAPPFTRSTLDGVYTDDEARAGDQVYKSICVSCHTPTTYSSPTFRRRWAGKPLSGLFYLIKETMPQNAPGSLDEYSYGVVVAYILKLNRIPAGKTPIMGDSVNLEKIRFDTVRTGPGGAR